jgi:hypothetical protein
MYGGGHASEGFENHILVYDLNTLEWTKLYDHDPCSAYSGTVSTGITTSGKPWIGHTYDHHDFIDHLGKLFYFQGTCGGFHKACNNLAYARVHNTWFFNFETNAWEFKVASANGPQSSTAATAYDPVTQKVYAGHKGSTYIYDPDANSWQKVTTVGSASGSIETNMVAAPDYGKVVQYGGNYPSNGETRVYDISSKTWTLPNPAVTPGTRKEIGMTWDTLHKQVVVYGGYGNTGSTVWFYDVPTNTWTGVDGANAPSTSNGSIHYDKVNNVFICVQQISYSGLTVWAFKLNDEGFGETSVSEERESVRDLEVSVYPNPFRSLTAINVCAKRKEKKGKIMIYDIRGKLVEEKSFLFPSSLFLSFSWDASDYAKGIYVMRVSIGANRHYYKILSVTQ